MARITYYGHGNRETGAERPNKNLRVAVKIDAVVTSGHGTGTSSSFKAKKVPGDIAWLLQEGMEVPVFTDAAGDITALDIEALGPLLAGEKDSLDAAQKEQTSLRYSAGLPTKDEVGQLEGALPEEEEGLGVLVAQHAAQDLA